MLGEKRSTPQSQARFRLSKHARHADNVPTESAISFDNTLSPQECGYRWLTTFGYRTTEQGLQPHSRIFTVTEYFRRPLALHLVTSIPL
jgi:hypothetical protein